MRNYYAFGRGLLAGVVLLAAAVMARAATPGIPLAAADSSKTSKGRFTAGLTYGNNSLFFGRTQTTRYPYLSGELTYKLPAGFWGSVVSYDLFNTASFVDETDASVGWDGDLSKSVDASVSYSHFFFAPNSPLLKSAVGNSLDGYLGWDWGYVYSRLSGSCLFGGAHDAFLILDNSRYFEINRVFTPQGYLSIEPRVSVLAGTQHFAQTSIERRPTGNGGNGNGNGHGGQGQGPTTTVTTDNTRFRVLNYEARVPVTYTLGKVAVETAWRYSIPVNLLPDDVTRARSYWTVGLLLNL
ncbi:hypothetical protein [Hymenobacter sp. CRA2]|uniref:hypothetical protein n=1 Tax=Hymenobacter sp. CRA2 TaxID=1955620 RepID=UPI0009CF69DC|nr:hypothetical protein [Hymenobacter sp. CRA2]OON67254.1 hypothetical protein B0919_19195 [Hymenobacter sp. CRA2]